MKKCKNCGLEKKLHVRGFICATPKEGALGTVFQPEDKRWECVNCGFELNSSKRPTRCSCKNGYVKYRLIQKKGLNQLEKYLKFIKSKGKSPFVFTCSNRECKCLSEEMGLYFTTDDIEEAEKHSRENNSAMWIAKKKDLK